MQPDTTPSKKKVLYVSTNCSNELKDLLLRPQVTKDIALSYDSIEKVMLQVQRDTVATGNDEEILQVIKGLKKIDNVLKLFAAEGRYDLK
jgi:hypothetical protein